MLRETSVQPNLTDLLAGYLQRQAHAQADGIASYDGEVLPYEVGPVQPLDPKLAWDETLAVLSAYGHAPAKRLQAPPQWAQFVGGHESVVAVAFCVGNFPQLMRNFHDVLSQPDLGQMRPSAGRPAAASELAPWVEQIAQKQQFPQMLLALGALRLAKNFDAAESFIRTQDANIPAAWRLAWDNEKAALLWHAGRYDDARKIWDALAASAPVLFNRGMSALFAGDAATARQQLTAAVAQIPVSSAWHHLGRLYLTLADLRR
jgi:tetratricopeptide (TPR) repeat protein